MSQPESGTDVAADRRSLMMVLFAALVLRLWRLGALSLWTDEASTWTAASGTLGELWRFCAFKDASPPLFHLLTWLALRLGDDEANLRLVSALAAVAMVWLTYRFARLWVERREALLAAALVALSPYQLMYAQEARTYMLVGVWTVLALYLFARAVLFERPRAWWPLTAALALGLWTQPIALLGVGVQGLLAVLTAAGRRRFVRWALAVAAAVASYVPWLVISARQAGHLNESHWYIDAPDPLGVFQVLRSVLLSPVPLVTTTGAGQAPGIDHFLPRPLAQLLLLAIALVPLALGVWAARRSDPRGRAARIALTALVAPLLAVFVVSFRQSLWLPRYFVLLTPFAALLTTYGLARMRPAALGRVWGVLVLLVSAYACLRVQWDVSKERWREVTQSIGARATAGRAAVLVPFDSDPFRYYDRRLPRPLPCIEVSHPAVPFHSHWTAQQLAEMADSARARATGFDDVWVIVRSPNSAQRRQVVALAEAAAAGEGRMLVLRETWEATGGPLWIARYRTPRPSGPTELRGAP